MTFDNLTILKNALQCRFCRSNNPENVRVMISTVTHAPDDSLLYYIGRHDSLEAEFKDVYLEPLANVDQLQQY